MGSSDRGRSWMDFEKQSETIMMAVWPWASGRLKRKSVLGVTKDMWAQGEAKAWLQGEIVGP